MPPPVPVTSVQLKFKAIWLVVRLLGGVLSVVTAGGEVVVNSDEKYSCRGCIVKGVVHGVYAPCVRGLVKCKRSLVNHNPGRIVDHAEGRVSRDFKDIVSEASRGEVTADQLKVRVIWLVVRLFKGAVRVEIAGGGEVSTVTKY